MVLYCMVVVIVYFRVTVPSSATFTCEDGTDTTRRKGFSCSSPSPLVPHNFPVTDIFPTYTLYIPESSIYLICSTFGSINKSIA